MARSKNGNLKIKDPNALAEAKKNRSNKKKQIIRKDSSSPKTKTKVVQWNYKPNQLVKFRNTGEYGLIVADKQFHNRSLETNYFFVLISNRVLQCNGRDIVPVSV
jgi:hypothetical protein